MKVASSSGLNLDLPKKTVLHNARCEWPRCKNKAQLKVSIDTGACVRYCYQHSVQFFKTKMREIVQWNRGLYAQRYRTPEQIAADEHKEREI